jgi:glycosyltransferase involved in cell wall biosynthesis
LRLSIIIPYYNTLSYTNELLKVLDPQITDDVECVLIDDGSTVPFKSEYDWLTVIRKENGGPATARNAGINNSSGEYIAFIDSDDLVAEYYVQ